MMGLWFLVSLTAALLAACVWTKPLSILCKTVLTLLIVFSMFAVMLGFLLLSSR